MTNDQARSTRRITILSLSAVALVLSACPPVESPRGGSPEDLTEPLASFFAITDGALERPDGYREWVFVGEPVTPNEMNGGKAPFPEFHTVYIDPVSYESYRETGVFPENTILIKELISVGSTTAVSGKGFFMGDFIGLEATIKSAEHFPDEPGNWAYFSFTNPAGGPLSKTAKPFPTKACNSCHQASAAEDFVFTQYYPVLRHAKTEERATDDETFTIQDGVLERPRGYRSWVFAGEPLTPNDLNVGKAAFPEFHDVYIDPESYEHLKKTGSFRDGTILIKELVSVGSKTAASGKGYFMGDFIGLEATIKSKTHFPDEPGNWAYFSFTSEGGGPPKAQATPFPTAKCNSCHQASAAEDFVFTQYYPVLRAAIRAAKGEAVQADNQWQPSAPHPREVAGMPLDRQALHAWLRSKAYVEAFAAQEKAKHPGRGPHTAPQLPVRVLYNQVLADSLAAGNTEHPENAVAIKEMFDEAGGLAGWAVMAKTGPSSDGGKNWFWYEVTSATDAGAVPAAGNGVPGCVSCHAVGGRDLILSGWPLQ